MVSSAGQRSQVRLVLRLTLYWWIASKHVTYINEHSESAPRLNPPAYTATYLQIPLHRLLSRIWGQQNMD